MKIETYSCDVKGCLNEAKHYNNKIPMLHTRTGDGSYLLWEEIDLCDKCYKTIVIFQPLNRITNKKDDGNWFSEYKLRDYTKRK